jgi:hypothetical protein
MEFTKPERKRLRELATIIYEAEAHRLLKELDAEFARWRKGECLSADLFNTLHEFHQHQSRNLWSIYQGLPDSAMVERGLSMGLIAESSVPKAILAKLQPWPSGPHPGEAVGAPDNGGR